MTRPNILKLEISIMTTAGDAQAIVAAIHAAGELTGGGCLMAA
jgi:hypothetical protein